MAPRRAWLSGAAVRSLPHRPLLRPRSMGGRPEHRPMPVTPLKFLGPLGSLCALTGIEGPVARVAVLSPPHHPPLLRLPRPAPRPPVAFMCGQPPPSARTVLRRAPPRDCKQPPFRGYEQLPGRGTPSVGSGAGGPCESERAAERAWEPVLHGPVEASPPGEADAVHDTGLFDAPALPGDRR